ncbi:hypothetical protein PYH37_005295 [Sinorhizobium numidicum]|uniref:Uncharacterized protein n=1 Tax=Sinorhizobium numidicum TaxID=680248 RepID=A0ABY8CY76_9HYPH|nr:hypothetical protein [Sinorhizobium numidicum]WEX76942.1 hypothetical protein PYH37_005295 [Sinorhizobium numidicum]WEX83601.1 hypothetical protein PYH38_002388 [Sinorhizobium numidicum]
MSVQTPKQIDRDSRPFDRRDRLILALYAQLKAERETRAAFEEAIANGVLSREVLQALVSDPIPVITGEDIVMIEQLLARDKHQNGEQTKPRRKATS